MCIRDSPKPDEPYEVAHPINGTLDQLAGLWKEHAKGWEWGKSLDTGKWYAENAETGLSVSIEDTGDEYRDRLALLLAVVKAGGG